MYEHDDKAQALFAGIKQDLDAVGTNETELWKEAGLLEEDDEIASFDAASLLSEELEKAAFELRKTNDGIVIDEEEKTADDMLGDPEAEALLEGGGEEEDVEEGMSPEEAAVLQALQAREEDEEGEEAEEEVGEAEEEIPEDMIHEAGLMIDGVHISELSKAAAFQQGVEDTMNRYEPLVNDVINTIVNAL